MREPASFVWADDDEMQREPTGPALGNYPASPSNWVDRRLTVGEKIARFLHRCADRAQGWR